MISFIGIELFLFLFFTKDRLKPIRHYLLVFEPFDPNIDPPNPPKKNKKIQILNSENDKLSNFEIENQNKGLHNYDDLINSKIIPARDVEIMKAQAEVRKENDFASLMREALIKSQNESLEMQKHGLINNQVLENTPDGFIDSPFDTGEIDMSFFDELNGF
jgi:hypothetical protein